MQKKGQIGGTGRLSLRMTVPYSLVWPALNRLSQVVPTCCRLRMTVPYSLVWPALNRLSQVVPTCCRLRMTVPYSLDMIWSHFS
jgi:hypothetical protein